MIWNIKKMETKRKQSLVNRFMTFAYLENIRFLQMHLHCIGVKHESSLDV